MEVLGETDRWLVLAKPSGIHTLKDEESENPSIEDWLKANYETSNQIPEAGIVHRLDQKTSGCLLVAKDQKSYEELRLRMSSDNGDIKKIYLAIAEGNIKPGKFKLYFTSRYKRSQKVSVSHEGTPQTMGRCEWKIFEPREHSNVLEVRILGRGKRHQIRAGFASLGHPLRGDTLYGGKLWREGFGLHSSRIEIDGKTIECPAPLNWYLGKSQRDPSSHFYEIDLENHENKN